MVLKGVVLLGAWIDGWVDEQDPIRLNQRCSNCIGFLCSIAWFLFESALCHLIGSARPLDLFDKRIIIVITYTTLQLVLHSLRDVLGNNQLNVGKSLVKRSAMTTISKQITV